MNWLRKRIPFLDRWLCRHYRHRFLLWRCESCGYVFPSEDVIELITDIDPALAPLLDLGLMSRNWRDPK